jgi:hypothetical protein
MQQGHCKQTRRKHTLSTAADGQNTGERLQIPRFRGHPPVTEHAKQVVREELSMQAGVPGAIMLQTNNIYFIHTYIQE